MLISEIVSEIIIERKLLLAFDIWATESPYTAKNESPKINAVTVKVMNFLHNFCPFVKPIFGQMMSSGYGALSIVKLKVLPLWLKSNLFPAFEHVKKFRILADISLGFSSTIKFLAILESSVTKKTGFCSLFYAFILAFISSLNLVILSFWALRFS